MPFTIVGFSESLDPAGAFVNLAAIIDQHVKTSGDYITIGEFNQIVAAYAAAGTGAAEARLISPSLRRTNPYYITPVEGDIAPLADPAMMYHPENPIPLDVNESLETEHNGNPAAAEQLATIVWLADGALTPITGEIFTVNAEITLAQVVNSWEFSEITFPDSLPVADYSVVGGRCAAAGAIAFRFVPVGASHRPGGVVAYAVETKDPFLQRFGRLGEWFTFNTVQPPGVEVLGSVAVGSTTYQIYIDLIKTT